MIISVASRERGTGKTNVAVSLALPSGNVQLLDCDVEEPNVHILPEPGVYWEKAVSSEYPSDRLMFGQQVRQLKDLDSLSSDIFLHPVTKQI